MNCLSIICRALRRIGVLASGQLPTDDEADDALETLKAIFLRCVSEGAFGQLADVIATEGSFTPPEFARVLHNDPDSTSIELPDTVTDRCGIVRPPSDGAVISIADTLTPLTVTYIYDGDLGRWIAVETMTLTSQPPIAARDANGLAAMLAVEIADEFGQEPTQATILAATRWQANLTGGWSRPDNRVAKTEYF